MRELAADDVIDYLRHAGRIGTASARAELLGGGVSNVVYRIRAAGELFILKQSRQQLRTKAAWFSDPERIFREQQVMEALFPYLPAGTVPKVLFDDVANYLFAMEHAPADARVWKEQLLAGDVDLAVGECAGRVLGELHRATAEHAPQFERFADATVFVQLRIDPFYRRVLERHPDLADSIAPLIDGMLGRREALCHGDFSPKNILTRAGGFMLVDYETAYFGDPTMDLGFFLSHLLLKAVKRPDDRARFFELIRAFWRGYLPALSHRPVAEWLPRAIGHLGVCLLARVDGTSPVDYLTGEAQRSSARRLGRRLLQARIADREDLFGAAEAEIAPLTATEQP